MLINQNVENAARIAMGPLVLEEPAIKLPRSSTGNLLRLAAAAALALAVVAGAFAIFS